MRAGVVLLALCGSLALSAPASQAATIHHTTAAVILTGAGQSGVPSQSSVTQQVFATSGYAVKQYWLTQTYGRVQLVGIKHSQGDVFGPYSVQDPCDINNGPQEAQAKAPKGVNFYAYQSTIWVLPSSCGGGGSGEQPGHQVWVYGLDRYVIDHELGHNFGNPHASSLRCFTSSSHQTPATLSNFCDAPDEYGDPFDPMGSGGYQSQQYHEAIPYEMEPWRKLNIGAMSLASAPTQNISGTHTYTIKPLENSSGLRMIRLPDGRGHSDGFARMFDLSFRQPTGIFDRWYNEPLDGAHGGDRSALTGVLVTWDPKLMASQTKQALPNSLLLDMTPTTAGPSSNPCTSTSPSSCNPCVHEPPGCYQDTMFGQPWVAENPWTHQPMTGFEDAPLPKGQSWSDPRTGLKLTVDSVGSTGATVTIAYSAGVVDVAAPTAPGSLHARRKAGGHVALSWTASFDNVGVTRYIVTRDGKTIHSDVTGTHILDTPGHGKHVYTVRGADKARNLGPAASVSITISTS